MATIISTNPFTQEHNGEFETFSRDLLDEKILSAHMAFLSWRNLPKSEKKSLFLRLAQVIESHLGELAELQTREMGMLYTASYA